ncbi:MAG TPA: DUF5722 domain-containing protein, partial [Roseimicrobium sp.]|nr:DUF5722 domain-containing protein [Roseimicrobium sp.]
DPALRAALLHPSYDPACPNHLSAFNTATADGVRAYQACVEFLADRYSGTGISHGRVAGYIIGNEVNSHWYWYNLGHASMEKVAEDYLRAVRMAFYAIRKSSSSARVYLSLEHHWNIRYPAGSETQSFAARPFLEHFARQAKASGDFEWHLAFHPYPENLGQPRTWLDKSATPLDDTPRVTFRNLDVLVRFMGKDNLLYLGKPRRIILSEQGFHSNGTPEGEQAQAAAYAYAYEKVSALDGIDSFILHRHVDHSKEGGLNLGLWRRLPESISTPSAPKPIYDVFKAAGTSAQADAFAFALPIIGITDWEPVRAGKR